VRISSANRKRKCLLIRHTVWNTHQRIEDAVAEAHIKELAALTPPVAIAVPSPFLPAIDEKHTVKVRFLFQLSPQV
jgi:hypothetical protein